MSRELPPKTTKRRDPIWGAHAVESPASLAAQAALRRVLVTTPSPSRTFPVTMSVDEPYFAEPEIIIKRGKPVLVILPASIRSSSYEQD